MTRLRYSTLKLMATSPRAYRLAVQDDAAHLRTGSATHALVYGTPRVVAYDGIRRGKEWEAFRGVHEAAGSIVVNTAEYETASAIAAAVVADPVVRELRLLDRSGAHAEERIEWDFCGRPFTSTPDLCCRHFAVDLKTTRYARPSWFLGEIMRRHYHVQAALYRLAIQQAHGYTPRDSYVVAVESKSPHHVVVYRLTPKLLAMGERTAALWLEQLRQCEAADEWPGYVSHVVDADVPEWDADEEIEEEDQHE
jgi:hypothetical protein